MSNYEDSVAKLGEMLKAKLGETQVRVAGRSAFAETLFQMLFQAGYSVAYCEKNAKVLEAQKWVQVKAGRSESEVEAELLQGMVRYRKLVPEDVKMQRLAEQLAKEQRYRSQRYHETKGRVRRMGRPYGDMTTAQRQMISGVQANLESASDAPVADAEQLTPELVAALRAQREEYLKRANYRR